MEASYETLEQAEKGISIEECIEKANKYIEKNGTCLFVMDLKNSTSSTNASERLNQLIADLNSMFEENMPENDLRAKSVYHKGFVRVLGDGLLAGINDSRVIEESANYIDEAYSDLSFYYNVAVDGYDEEAIKTIK